MDFLKLINYSFLMCQTWPEATINGNLRVNDHFTYTTIYNL
jgi:hypothetical protein